MQRRHKLSAVGSVAVATLAMAIVAACSAAAPAPTAPANTTVGATVEPSVTKTPAAATPQSPTSPANTDPAEVAKAKSLIEAADLTNPASLDEVGGAIRFSRAGEQASREIIESATATTAVLWAAVWVYASAGSDPAPLRTALRASDPSVRSMAAATLVSLGDRSGFPVLAEALAEQGSMSGSEPPINVATYAYWALTNYTALQPAPAEADWPAWLSEHGEGMVFDPADGTWKLP
jgi:hypothetical protein